MLRLRYLLIAFASFLGVTAPTAWAHRPSDAFITLDIEGTALSGQIDLALRDLDFVLGLDRTGDFQVRWGDVRRRTADIEAYVAQHLTLEANGAACKLQPLDLLISNHTDGAYASVIFNTTCMTQPVSDLLVHYDAMMAVDAQHRGLLKLHVRETEDSAVLTAAQPTYHYAAGGGGTHRLLAQFVREGIHHIFGGIDHMLFLVALVLPAVFVRKGGRYEVRPDLKSVLWDTGAVITSFTIAHSLSLALTTFHVIIPPPARDVEILVALTILATAANNLFPLLKERRWLMGFGFGLIHGIGYASVLGDLGLTGWNLAIPLIGFNVGVELAQLAIIGTFLPLAYLLRRTLFYRRVMLWGGSFATGGLAVAWIVELLMRVRFLPF